MGFNSAFKGLKGFHTEVYAQNCVLIFKFLFHFGIRFEENGQQKCIEVSSGFCENQ
jgi:hypothetical protein